MANIQLANYDPRDMNYLRQLYAAGKITDEDLNSGTLSVGQNALAQMMQPPQQQAPQIPDNLARAVPGAGFQDLQSGQGVVQQEGGPVIRINSRPQSYSQDLSSMADVTRPIEIAGQGKGYYSKDGKSAIINGQQVMLGYDREKTQANQDRALKIAKANSELEHQAAQTANEREKLRQAQLPPGMPAPPSGYQWNADGSLASIKGGPADQANKPTTEDEKRSAGLAIRMENSLKTMQEIGKQHPDAVKPGVLATAAGALPMIGGMLENTINSSPRRQIEATQLDALDAALTLATGAAYTKEQLKNLAKSYFPQIGDQPEDVAFKQQLLDQTIQTARIRAGGAAKNIDTVLNREKPANLGDKSRALFDARKAIQRGANPSDVKARLQKMGITEEP